MTIIKSNETNVNENVLLYKWSNERKEELESDIKTYINYQEGDKVSIIVYPTSDDKEVLKELAQDLMQQYSILSNNRKNKVIDIFDL